MCLFWVSVFMGIFSSKTMTWVSVVSVSIYGLYSSKIMAWVFVLGASVYGHI